MKISEKVFGTIVLTAFVLMAGSVVCLASGQAGAMGDCGNGGMATAAVCPFMSVSVPTVLNVSSIMKTLAFVAVLVLIAGFAFKFSFKNSLAGKLFAVARVRGRDPAAARRFNIVLDLISNGILHPRVFGL